jgi:hypothetical protein
MIDENAFGILIAYFDIENAEYGLDREQFVERFEQFRATVLGHLEANPLGNNVRALYLGHALYVELAEGDQSENPLSWARRARQLLDAREFLTVAAITHGSRWVEEESPAPPSSTLASAHKILHVSTPSEPLRRALHAETASHDDDEDDRTGWGPGLYVDLEALEALSLKPKNAPTPLCTAGATFYRVGV